MTSAELATLERARESRPEPLAVNICILAAGAGGMYCGSCMRDNALAQALLRQGHRVTLVPLYTPLRTEPRTVSIGRVFYGGVNVYLQHASRLFRRTPRLFDWLLDRPALLRLAGKFATSKPPEELAGLTLDILRGEEGPAVKELRRLLQFLKGDVKPQVVSLPNLMFVGMARAIREELGVPVVCELTGEDIFLDAMRERDRRQVQEAIRGRASDVTRFVATSEDYAGRMARYLDLPRERIDVVYPGVPTDYVAPQPKSHTAGGPPGVAYVARVCPEKGLHRLIDAMLLLQKLPGMADVRLAVAGYVGRDQQRYYADQQGRVAKSALNSKVTFLGEVDRPTKLDVIDRSDVLCVPTDYPEAKGIYVLESLARGVPVVQPAHGSFPELIDRTGGGVLVRPGDAAALAEGLADLLRDPRRRAALGAAGHESVRAGFTDDHMARNMLSVYESVTDGARPQPAAPGVVAV